MKLKNIAVIAVIAIVSGCKSTPTVRDIPLNTPTNTQNFEYKKLNGNAKNVVTLYRVKSAIERHVNNHTGFNHCGRSGGCSKRKSGDFTDIWGKEISMTDTEVKISYYNGEKFKSGSPYLSKVHTAIPYSITETDSSFLVSLAPATKATAEDGKDAIYIPISSPIKDESLQHKLTEIMTSKGPEINGTVYSKGEFNVNFDPASVQTNFERKLKRRPLDRTRLSNENNSNNRVYKNSYELSVSGITAKVGVNIFLYRGKSKVEYSLSHPVSVTAKGGIDYDEKIMTKLLEYLKEVANS